MVFFKPWDEQGFDIVKAKHTCNSDSDRWLSTGGKKYDTAAECASACKKSRSTAWGFAWVANDDKNCKCVPSDCPNKMERDYRQNIYKYKTVSILYV